MPLHTIIGFVADFPTQNDGLKPAGRELADFVYSQLTKAGFNTSAPEDREGWAWDICTRDGDLQVETIVGFVDDMEQKPPRQWLITNDCHAPFLKRLFGKSDLEAKRETLLKRLCETLHGSMTGDARFSHLTWYNKDTFDKPGDTPSSKP